MQDEENEFNINRDLIEYHAGFIEPEIVKKVRESRERTIKVSNDEFAATLRDIFGRDIDPNKLGQKNISSTGKTIDLKQYDEDKNIWDKIKV